MVEPQATFCSWSRPGLLAQLALDAPATIRTQVRFESRKQTCKSIPDRLPRVADRPGAVIQLDGLDFRLADTH